MENGLVDADTAFHRSVVTAAHNQTYRASLTASCHVCV